MADLLGLKELDGEIFVTHRIENKSALRMGLAIFTSSLALLLIGKLIELAKK